MEIPYLLLLTFVVDCRGSGEAPCSVPLSESCSHSRASSGGLWPLHAEQRWADSSGQEVSFSCSWRMVLVNVCMAHEGQKGSHIPATTNHIPHSHTLTPHPTLPHTNPTSHTPSHSNPTSHTPSHTHTLTSHSHS